MCHMATEPNKQVHQNEDLKTLDIYNLLVRVVITKDLKGTAHNHGTPWGGFKTSVDKKIGDNEVADRILDDPTAFDRSTE